MDSSALATWLGTFFSLIALVLFAIVERKKLLPNRKTKSKSGRSSNPPGDETLEFIDVRAEVYSRILVGIILGFAVVNLYQWFANLRQDSLRNDHILFVVLAVLLSASITLLYIRVSRDLTSFFVHWAERFSISYLYFYLVPQFSNCGLWNIVGSDTQRFEFSCSYIGIPQTVFMTAIVIVLISFPQTPVDWLVMAIKRKPTPPTNPTVY